MPGLNVVMTDLIFARLLLPRNFSHPMSSNTKVSIAGLLIALGIIYGDIGTSPLYVLNAIMNGKVISE